MFDRDSGAAVVVVTVRSEPKRSLRDEVYQRIRDGKCIHHEEDNNGRIVWCDGQCGRLANCNKHYTAVNGILKNLPAVKVAEIKSKLVYEGQILLPQFIRWVKKPRMLELIKREVLARGMAS